MRRLFLFGLSILSFAFSSFSQTDILQPPTEQEKGEVLRILGEYEKFMKAIGDSALPKEKKAGATLKFIKDLYNNDVQVYYDLDTIPGEDKFLKIFSYAQKFREVFPQTVTSTLSDVNLSKVKYDKIRRYFYIEAAANKKFEWRRIRQNILKDAVSGKDSIAFDTLKYGFNKKETFYIRFERVNNISKNFKLFTVARTGGEPKLEPLPPIMTWWLEMDPQWKAFFREKVKLDEYPSTWDIERVTGQPELDISNKPFKTLEPLRKMVFLQKLICVNTPIQSLEPLNNVTSLLILDVSKSGITSLDGIEKLTSLQELKCASLKLESVEPLKNLTNLIKLDISDNELLDISPISELINLKELDFSSNVKLDKIDPVKKLTLLEKLSFQKVKAGTLEPVRNLINLIHLDAFNSEITSLEPIRNLQKLIFLNIDHCRVTSLEPIRNYKFITDLSLSTSSVTDLSPLKDFKYLRVLNVSNIQITTLGPVMNLEYIRELQCQMTKVPKEEVARFKKSHPGCKISYWY